VRVQTPARGTGSCDTRASSALSRLTPYLTPYGAVSPGFRRTNSLFGRLMLNTGRPCTGTAEHTEDELENRRGRQAPGGSNPSPSAKIPLVNKARAPGSAPLAESLRSRRENPRAPWTMDASAGKRRAQRGSADAPAPDPRGPQAPGARGAEAAPAAGLAAWSWSGSLTATRRQGRARRRWRRR
jgi:hypothetical protein